MPPTISMSLHWQPGQGSMFPLQHSVAARKSTKALLMETEALVGERTSGDSGGARPFTAALPILAHSCCVLIRQRASWLTGSGGRAVIRPGSAARSRTTSSASSPVASWFSQAPCEPVKAPLERRHTEAVPPAPGGELSLLDRLDGAWMGSGAQVSAGSHSERLARRKGRSGQLPPADVRHHLQCSCLCQRARAAGIVGVCCEYELATRVRHPGVA